VHQASSATSRSCIKRAGSEKAGGERYGIAIQPVSSGGIFEKTVFDEVYDLTGKPLIICDFAVNFPTQEHPNIMWDAGAKTEEQAADIYEIFLKAAFATPYVVGVHRCTYIDKPSPEGILKQGLIRQDGTPCEITVRKYKEIHQRLLRRLYRGN